LNSPDRRGGGGDGGLDPVILESRRGSGPGEWVRLGILNDRGELAGVVEETRESGLRKAVCSPRFGCVVLSLGGDRGGCIRTEGGRMGFVGFGLRGGGGATGRAGDREWESSLLLGIFRLLKVGLFFGTGGGVGAASRSGFASRSAIGFGAGDIGRKGAAERVGFASLILLILSKCERREETGF